MFYIKKYENFNFTFDFEEESDVDYKNDRTIKDLYNEIEQISNQKFLTNLGIFTIEKTDHLVKFKNDEYTIFATPYFYYNSERLFPLIQPGTKNSGRKSIPIEVFQHHGYHRVEKKTDEIKLPSDIISLDDYLSLIKNYINNL